MLHCSLARPPIEPIGLLDHRSVGPFLAPQMTIHISLVWNIVQTKKYGATMAEKQAQAKERRRKKKNESKCCHGRFKETQEITKKKREPKAPLSPAVHPPDYVWSFTESSSFALPSILLGDTYSYAHFLSWGVFSHDSFSSSLWLGRCRFFFSSERFP